MRLSDIERNNIGQAERYYNERNEIDGDVLRVLYKLQDDPSELERISSGWVIATPDPLDF